MHNTNGTVYTTLHKDISGSQALRATQETKLGNAALSEIGKLVTSINWKNSNLVHAGINFRVFLKSVSTKQETQN